MKKEAMKSTSICSTCQLFARLARDTIVWQPGFVYSAAAHDLAHGIEILAVSGNLVRK